MIHYRTCSICEALCGVQIEVQAGKITSIRGNPEDPLSQGYICPKALALQDIHEDPDRIREPLRKTSGGFEPISWEDALDEVALRLHGIRQEHGAYGVGVYLGNPNAHNYGTLLMSAFFNKALKTRSRFSATSADQLPHMFAAFHMFGHQLLLPVPDMDRTRYVLMMGANPLASNGSIMTAPNMRQKIKDLRSRGGRLVVLDPRRTETALGADAHYGILPGTDAWFLLAFLHTLFEEGHVRGGEWEAYTEGLEIVREAVSPYSPERVATVVGVEAALIRTLAAEFSAAEGAALYGRVGVCTQRFGGLCAWLINVINIVTANLDRPGGVMFTRPAFDLVAMSAANGQRGHYDLWRSRLRGLPEFGGELPVSVMAEEMVTPGEGQIRGLMTVAGNPALSTPNGKGLTRAMEGLEFMVSLDRVINETTRHADIILPSTSPLERDHFGLVFHTLAVRNTAKFSQPLFTPPAGVKHDWEIMLELSERLRVLEGGVGNRIKAKGVRLLRKLGPQMLLDLGLRRGTRGAGFNLFKGGLSLRKLKASPHGVDLGPLEPCLPERLYTPQKTIRLAPDCLVQDLKRLDEACTEVAPKRGEFLLIGRRHLRSNNTWLHNTRRLAGGSRRCTLLMHPGDADEVGLNSGELVTIQSRVGAVEAPLELSDTMMPGVVSLPHGWGHGGKGVELKVAREDPGVSLNDLTDEQHLDTLTGNAGFSGVKVRVEAS